jgi:hypothetical protein
LLENLGHALAEHQRGFANQIGGCLKDYFDPESGRFNERVERLIRKDGELERLLRSQIGGDGSELAQTLAGHMGEHSPLMQMLDPEASDGLVSALATSVEKTLNDQRERILSEFSLDNKEGALSRLVVELVEQHGEVGESLGNRIHEVMAEFSLDREDSALSRLVGRVEKTQRQISSEFSLDEEGSALARTRRPARGSSPRPRRTPRTPFRRPSWRSRRPAGRDAGVGLFVFSACSAPEGLEPFSRYGADVVIVWDAEDPRSGVILVAGLSVARALCARARARSDAETADFEVIERAILEIEKQARGLEEVTRSAETIKSGSEKILKRAEIMHRAFGEQLEFLNKKVQNLKRLLGETGTNVD